MNTGVDAPAICAAGPALLRRALRIAERCVNWPREFRSSGLVARAERGPADGAETDDDFFAVPLETITGDARDWAKSPNKHNRFYVKVAPQEPELQDFLAAGGAVLGRERAFDDLPYAIEGDLGLLPHDPDSRRALADLLDHANFRGMERIITAAGGSSDVAGTNTLVDDTTDVDLSACMGAIVRGFTFLCRGRGPVAGLPLWGVAASLENAVSAEDPRRRGLAQLIPTLVRAMSAACLRAGAALIEPIAQLHIVVHESNVGAVYGLLNRERGIVISENLCGPFSFVAIGARVALDKIGPLAARMRQMVTNPAHAACARLRVIGVEWEMIPGSYQTEGTLANQVALAWRRRNNQQDEPAEKYWDPGFYGEGEEEPVIRTKSAMKR